MIRLPRTLSSLGLTLLALAAMPLAAQSVRRVLVLQTANGQTIFHTGERISLKLTFSSPNDTQYAIAPWNSGRGGEFASESFAISPSSGWSDPLTTYLAQDLIFFGHGWEPQPLLQSKPVQISLDLNQWVRFDQPGTYSVKVTSHRVSSQTAGNGQQPALESNSIELQIVPATPEWQNATLQRIRIQLNQQYIYPQFDDAVDDLRYLATPAGIAEMIDRLPHNFANVADKCSMGLKGLPNSMREAALAAMNKRIDDPSYPVSLTFFETMSFLQLRAGSDPQSIREQLRAATIALWPVVFASVPGKKGAVRAETVQMLLQLGHNIDASGVQAQMAQLVSESLPSLDQGHQIEDLRQHWDLLRSPGILPVLQALARLPPNGDPQFGPSSRMDLKSVALKRWYEFDPDGAHREVLAQIGSSDPALSAEALTFLPAEQLPQFEGLWAQAFLDTTDQLRERLLGSLLIRFGTGAASPAMIAKLNEEPRNYGCDAHARALAYLLHFSPEEAREPLEREFATDEAGCGGGLLNWVSEYAHDPVLNRIVVKRLDAPNLNDVLSTLQYLTSYGTKPDESPIWDRYAKWARQWSGKGDLLDHPETAPGCGMEATFNVTEQRRSMCREISANAQVGMALATALIANQGWLAGQKLVSRVVERCVGQNMCLQLQALASQASPPHRLGLPSQVDSMEVEFATFAQTYRVSQYAPKSIDLFEEKISQYPPGTRFEMATASALNGSQKSLEKTIQAILAKHGMIVSSAPVRTGGSN